MIRGMGNFVWFTGVVEDINDPLKLGRVRVRCHYFHSGDRNILPVKDLPWATPLQPVTSAAKSGIGTSPTGLVQGSHVCGFFQDGDDAQLPIILGSIAQIPQEGAKETGFHDPDLDFPRESSINYSSVVKEQDTSRLARNENIEETAVEFKKKIRQTEIPIANREDKWEEPETPYNAEYPHNHVHQSRSGHVIEIDDTEGSERLHTYHRSGTFEEIHPDGSKVTKVIGDKYEIVTRGENVWVKGDMNLIVGATAPGTYPTSNISILVRGNADIQVDGDSYTTVGGNMKSEVEGSMEANVKGQYGLGYEGDWGTYATGDIVIATPNSISLFAGKDITLQSGKDGGKIDLNPT